MINIKVLNWGKINFGGIRWQLAEIDLVRLFADEGKSGTQVGCNGKTTAAACSHLGEEEGWHVTEPWITKILRPSQDEEKYVNQVKAVRIKQIPR